MGDLIKRNPFAVLSELREAFKPKRVSDYEHARISTKGEFELVDYNAGLYVVSIKVSGQPKQDAEGKYLKENGYVTRLYVGNLDDCAWDSSSVMFDTLEEAQELKERMLPLLDKLTVMPKAETLNEMLRPYGLYGEFTS